LYVVSIVILKPFRVHQKRPVSTISLKVSYLVYLLAFLLLAYLVLFYSSVPAEDEENPAGKNPFLLYYITVILAFFIPNLGIMLRRRFNKYRTNYNLIFTAINLFTALVLSFIIYIIPWEF